MQNVKSSETKNMLIRDFRLFLQDFLTFFCNTLQNCVVGVLILRKFTQSVMISG